MSTRTFCDVCEKEFKFRDSWQVKIMRTSLTYGKGSVQLHEVCTACVDKVKKAIQK